MEAFNLLVRSEAPNGAPINVCYSNYQDLQYFRLDANGDVIERVTDVTGFDGFSGPLDVTQDRATGFLYVTELNGQKITLLRPDSGN